MFCEILFMNFIVNYFHPCGFKFFMNLNQNFTQSIFLTILPSDFNMKNFVHLKFVNENYEKLELIIY